MTIVGTFFFGFHLLTFCSVCFSIIYAFKNPAFLLQPLLTSTILHLFVGYINLRAQSNIPFLKRFLMNESVHIIPCNLIFFYLRIPSFNWIIAIGLSSLYHILSFLTSQFLPSNPNNWFLQKCRDLFQKLSLNSICEFIVSMMEIMAMFPTFGRASAFITFLYILTFLFWFILYRYATSNSHRMIWNRLRQSVATLAYKLPTFLCNIIMNILRSNEQLGTLGCKIYHY